MIYGKEEEDGIKLTRNIDKGENGTALWYNLISQKQCFNVYALKNVWGHNRQNVNERLSLAGRSMDFVFLFFSYHIVKFST